MPGDRTPLSTEPGQRKNRSRGGRLARSETVTVRLDPKLRYLAELAARKQRRTVSSFIEWAIEESLDRVVLLEGAGFDANVSIADESSSLWDVDEPDRFAKLAIRYPDLLTHEEQVLWKLIRENGYLWRGSFSSPNSEWAWKIEEEKLCFDRLRESWDTFKAVAQGDASQASLPTWSKTNKGAEPGKSAMQAELDDEIPF